eukprot:TRINITY_DN15019_c0_g1_i1.p1 TRINITY_DN15019_c0_g1~~TRINITY_DN15019_c0_g1_i1.p1  ORF type:complete len:472 (-),score=120.89 TRINITY_DN15019_c0_g1_i1:39-1454(-)
MAERAAKRFVLEELRSHALTATSEAVKALATIAREKQANGENPQSWIAELLLAIGKEELNNGVVDGDLVARVGHTMQEEDSGDPTSNTFVIDAFEVPKLTFNPIKAKFEKASDELSRFGQAEAKIAAFRERYLLVEQRLLRHPSFIAPFAVTVERSLEFYQLTKIEALSGAKTGEKYVLGLLAQPNPGEFMIEDLTGSMAIDLSQTEVTEGFFTEGCLVLVVGEVVNAVFHVNMIGMPPQETAQDTRQALGNVDFFGQASKTLDVSRLQQMEEEATDVRHVFLSDVLLDKREVLQRLEELFQGFEACPPMLFVLAGPFTSRALGQGGEDMASYTDKFTQLAQLICRYPSIAEQSHFVFVPAMSDPGMGKVWPRPAIPDIFFAGFKEMLPEYTATSNPARIRFYSQEIVIGRMNYMHDMQRHAVLEPSETTDPATHLAKTLLSPVSYTHLRAHETPEHLVCRLLLEKKKRRR